MNVRTHPGRGGVIALLLLLAATASCQRGNRPPDARRKGGTNLLLITLDTTRADRIGAYGDRKARTPVLDRLAREGVRFARAYTSAPLTLPAHATLMTGREPPEHLVRNNGTYALRAEENTLAEALRTGGFSTQAFIAAYVLEKKFGLAQGFDGYDDELPGLNGATTYRSEIPSSEVYAKFARWLEKRPAAPFFCWVHLYDPHFPYQPPPALARAFPGDPYRGEIAAVDETIGRMLDDLRGRGLLANTLVVVAGDHGEGFGEHGEYDHGVFCYEETLRVPLIFFQEGLLASGSVVTQPVGLSDVLPTLLELYRLPNPAGVTGRSFAQLLTAADESEKTARTHYFESRYGQEEMGWAPLTGLVKGSHKYISLPEPELYDITADPQERDNLYLKNNRLAKQLARELKERLVPETGAGATALRTTPSRQDQARLQALGYLASAGEHVSQKKGADPKEEIATFSLLREGRMALRSGDLALAASRLEALRRAGSDRDLPQFYDLSYEFYQARKDPVACESTLRQAIARFPDQSRFSLLLASLFRNQGRERETEALALRILTSDPGMIEAHLLLGEIYRQRKAFAKAIEHFAQAWKLAPHDHNLAIALASLQLDAGEQGPARATLRALLTSNIAGTEPGKQAIQAEAAKLLLKLGDSVQAEKLLSGLVSAQGNDPAHWVQLGLAQLDRGEGNQAEQSFLQALRRNSRHPLALSGLGTLQLTLFQQRKNPDSLRRAAEFFTQAREADPLLVTAVNGLGVVALYQGDIPRAIGELKQAIALDPTFVNARFNLAIAQLSRGMRLQARQTLSPLQTKLAGRLSEAEKRQLVALLGETGPQKKRDGT